YKFTTGPGADNGVHTFPITLVTAGNQRITATDTLASAPVITGASSTMAVAGFGVQSLTPAPTGFVVTFNKPLAPANLAFYGAGAKTAAASLVGAAVGAIDGTLLLDPSGTSARFKATANALNFLNTVVGGGPSSVVLPDDTYTVTLNGGQSGFTDNLGA